MSKHLIWSSCVLAFWQTIFSIGWLVSLALAISLARGNAINYFIDDYGKLFLYIEIGLFIIAAVYNYQNTKQSRI